jgi:hypothetical protein
MVPITAANHESAPHIISMQYQHFINTFFSGCITDNSKIQNKQLMTFELKYAL